MLFTDAEVNSGPLWQSAHFALVKNKNKPWRCKAVIAVESPAANRS